MTSNKTYSYPYSTHRRYAFSVCWKPVEEHVRKRYVGVSNLTFAGANADKRRSACAKGKYLSFPISSIVIDGNLNLFCQR
jgi:hypothetical protein